MLCKLAGFQAFTFSTVFFLLQGAKAQGIFVPVITTPALPDNEKPTVRPPEKMLFFPNILLINL